MPFAEVERVFMALPPPPVTRPGPKRAEPNSRPEFGGWGHREPYSWPRIGPSALHGPYFGPKISFGRTLSVVDFPEIGALGRDTPIPGRELGCGSRRGPIP